MTGLTGLLFPVSVFSQIFGLLGAILLHELLFKLLIIIDKNYTYSVFPDRGEKLPYICHYLVI
jgi:hypothetical protein